MMSRVCGPVLTMLVAAIVIALVAVPSSAEVPRTGQGLLEIIALPEGSEVLVDGELVGRSPIEAPLALSVGEHRVKVHKLGHTQHLQVVKLSARQKTTVEAYLPAVAGVLEVRSSVEKVRVFFDDDYLGDAPLTAEVEPGEHLVRASAQGYEEFSQTFELVAGEVTEVEVELIPLPQTAEAEEPRRRDWYQSWWFWTVVGAVVVSAAIAVPVAITQQGDECEEFFHWESCGSAINLDIR